MAGVLKAKWIKAADYRKGRGGKTVQSVILHSTCGRKLGDIETLTGEGGPVVSCHYYVTRKGELYQFVKETDTAYHAGRVKSPKYGNQQSIGIEQEHWDPDEHHPDGEDWPEVQIRVVASLIAYLREKYSRILTIKSHAEVAVPKGRKSDPADYPWDQLSFLVAGAMKTEWEIELR